MSSSRTSICCKKRCRHWLEQNSLQEIRSLQSHSMTFQLETQLALGAHKCNILLLLILLFTQLFSSLVLQNEKLQRRICLSYIARQLPFLNARVTSEKKTIIVVVVSFTIRIHQNKTRQGIFHLLVNVKKNSENIFHALRLST